MLSTVSGTSTMKEGKPVTLDAWLEKLSVSDRSLYFTSHPVECCAQTHGGTEIERANYM